MGSRATPALFQRVGDQVGEPCGGVERPVRANRRTDGVDRFKA